MSDSNPKNEIKDKKITIGAKIKFYTSLISKLITVKKISQKKKYEIRP